MGIRCYCPNGHKLNLKSHLAGERGICPECGVTFMIPREDERDPIKPQKPKSNDPGDVPHLAIPERELIHTVKTQAKRRARNTATLLLGITALILIVILIWIL